MALCAKPWKIFHTFFHLLLWIFFLSKNLSPPVLPRTDSQNNRMPSAPPAVAQEPYFHLGFPTWISVLFSISPCRNLQTRFPPEPWHLRCLHTQKQTVHLPGSRCTFINYRFTTSEFVFEYGIFSSISPNNIYYFWIINSP